MRSRRWLWVLVAAAAAAALWWGATQWSSSGFRWGEFKATLGRVNRTWMGVCFLFSLLAYVVRALRWRAIMTPVKRHPGFRSVFSATCIGFTAVVLFGRPGELVRPWLIASRERVSLSSQLAAWFLERVFDLLAVVLMFGFALTGVDEYPGLSPRLASVLRAGGILAVAAGLACVLLVAGTALFSGLARRLSERVVRLLPQRLGSVARHGLDSFLTGLACTGQAGPLLRISLWTVLEWFVIAAGAYALFQAFGPPTASFGVNATLIYVGFVAFGGAVTLPGIGGGLQVSSLLILRELFGLPLAMASAYTLLFWATSWLAVAPIGLLLAFREGLQWNKLKEMSELQTGESSR